MRDGRRPDRRREGQGSADHRPSTGAAAGARIRLFGVHAVAAALANPVRTVHRLCLTDNAEHRLADVLRERGARHERVTPRDLDRMLGTDTVHQGALIETEPLPEPALSDLAARAAAGGLIVVLDQVTDPHNVGAVLRSAAVFAAAGLVLTRRHSPELSGTLAKTASGALEHVPVALVTNLARALEELAELGVQRIGLDGEAEMRIEDADLAGAVALVLGSEGRGLRRLTREGCDRLCRIAAPGPIQSLNVSNAAAIALHAASLRRR
jgi:23S rRNA (guanosine2251-2'-O)-methyltransferase